MALVSLEHVKTRIAGYQATSANDALLQQYADQASAWFLSQTGRAEEEFAGAPPADVVGAVADWTAYLWAMRDRVGVMSRSGMDQSVTFQTLTVPVHVQSVVDAHRSFRTYFARST